MKHCLLRKRAAWYYLYEIIDSINVRQMQKELKIVLNGSSTPEKFHRCEITKSVDTTGMACPYPSFESVKAMSLLNDDNANGCVEIITDSEESAFKSIPSVCQKRNWEFLVMEEAKDLWRIRIKR
jgi:TusA-related sulfurtransferase